MKWTQFFNISKEQMRHLMKHKPSNIDLLVWCLETGKIDKAKYLEWAKNHYKIPILKSSFFQKSKADLNWIKSVYHDFQKYEMIAPLFYWEKKGFVACLEPLKNPPWNFQTQWVLCNYQDLKVYKLYLKKTFSKGSQDKGSEKIKSEKIKNLHDDLKPYVLYEKKPSFLKNEAIIYEAFSELQKKFEKVLFLGYGKNKVLKFLRCDENWDIKNYVKISKPIDLSKNSVFKILHTTAHPFHGPVYPSEENNRFFQACGYENSLPQHLTALPVFSDASMTRLLGFLLAVGWPRNFSTDTLVWAQKIAQKLSRKFIILQETINKAVKLGKEKNKELYERNPQSKNEKLRAENKVQSKIIEKENVQGRMKKSS